MNTQGAEKKDVEILKQKLLKLLGAQDPKSLSVIRQLRKIGEADGDNGLIGYAYYRYAYYYYFSNQDLKKFRKYLQLAIRYLLRSDDKEFLGGAYNLVAYDAQDQGSYDVAYAYFMIALQTAEQVSGIALPGLLAANAGRLLVELDNPRKGRAQLREAARRMRPFTNMHVYNYNMIFTYADVALSSFLLRDLRGVERAREQVGKFFEKANENEVNLALTYVLLTEAYHSLLSGDRKKSEEDMERLTARLRDLSDGEMTGMIFEVEALCGFFFEEGPGQMAEQVLDATDVLSRDENLTVALRYHTLRVMFYEKTKNAAKLRRALRAQHEIQKRHNAEAMKLRQYTIEFADMIENITKEREEAREENSALRVQVNTDALTGLPNRNAINRTLAEKYEEALRDGASFGIGVIDVDGFKQYNDSFGHRAGDACLQRIGKILLSFASDPRLFCARYGGDEFVVGYFGMTDREIRAVVEDMRERIAAETSLAGVGGGHRVWISQGFFNRVPDGNQKFWDYLSLADQELYRVKKSS